MSVTSFDPNSAAGSDTPQVSLSAAAIEHIREQLNGKQHAGVRIGVKESGCNGYMYTLDYVEAPSATDRVIRVGGDVEVYVESADLPLVNGTSLDYVREGLNATLQFKNPRAESYCGCGESFSIAEAAQ